MAYPLFVWGKARACEDFRCAPFLFAALLLRQVWIPLAQDHPDHLETSRCAQAEYPLCGEPDYVRGSTWACPGVQVYSKSVSVGQSRSKCKSSIRQRRGSVPF
jgi:hypothetical protein